jgi:hypothetical protein
MGLLLRSHLTSQQMADFALQMACDGFLIGQNTIKKGKEARKPANFQNHSIYIIYIHIIT